MNNVTDLTGLVEGERAHQSSSHRTSPRGRTCAKNPKGEYFLEVENMPAIQHEPNAPPVQSLAYARRFYYSPYLLRTCSGTSEIKRWAKKLNHYAEPTPAIRDAAIQIIDGVTTPEAKARKLYDAVQTLENTALRASHSRRPESVIAIEAETEYGARYMGGKRGNEQ